MSGLRVEERALRVRLHDAPTLVLQFRNQRETSCAKRGARRLRVLLIPGNPGVPGFYRQFVLALLRSFVDEGRPGLDVQVDVISHAGHAAEVLTTEDRRSGGPVYSLSFQIQHKAAYLRRLLAELEDDDDQHAAEDGAAASRRSNTRVVVIAHSIGCLIACHLAAQSEFDRVERFLFLTPVIQQVEQGLDPLIRFAITPFGMPLLGHLANSIPGWLLRHLVDTRLTDVDHPEWKDVILTGFCRSVLQNAFYMTRTEVKHVRDLPLHLLGANAVARMLFVFSPHNDSYTPPHLIAEMTRLVPDAEIVHLPAFVPHAFVQCSRSIDEMTGVLAGYLQKEGFLSQTRQTCRL